MVDNEADLRQIEGGQVRTKVLDDGWGRGHLRGVDWFMAAEVIAVLAGALVLMVDNEADSRRIEGGQMRMEVLDEGWGRGHIRGVDGFKAE